MPSGLLGKITKILTAATPFLCLAGIVAFQAQEYKKSANNFTQDNYLAQEQKQRKSVAWQRYSPNLGLRNLKADWSYLKFVQYFGHTKARETIGYKLVPDYFATVSHLDPRFTKAHLRLSVANSMYAANPEQTIGLMQQVLDIVEPESEEAASLWTSKGLDELLFMGDKQAAIKSYDQAAQWETLAQSYRPDNLTIKDLEAALQDASEIDLKQAQIRAWSTVLVHVRDHHKKRSILNKIDLLKSEIALLETKSDESLSDLLQL